MELKKSLLEAVERFAKVPEVEGIMLAGSFTNNTSDSESDYDVYVYTTAEISVEKRREILDDLCSYMEYDNKFWETEDDGIFREGDMPVEFIYRDLNWIDGMVEGKIIKHYADTGYTTCFWANLINSKILFDRNGRLETVQKKYMVPFPKELKRNIIDKNYPLLKKQMPAYFYQIEKAVRRGDQISVNHRVAAFFASYFDIIFAVNEIPHPGEKKIIKILNEWGKKLPQNMESDINELMNLLHFMDKRITEKLNVIIEKIENLLRDEKLIGS